MKVMITYPPLVGKGSPMLTQNRQFQWYTNPSYIYPLIPAQAATLLLKNGVDVVWNDSIAEKLDWNGFLDLFKNTNPNLVAIETKTPVVKQHWEIIKKLKSINPDCLFVLMGDHVTALPYESRENSLVDYVLVGGNYDFLLLNLVEHLKDGKELCNQVVTRETPPNSYLQNHNGYNLDDLPFIDRRLTNWQIYGEKWKKRVPFMYTLAGRDCHWAKCTFCSWTTTFPKFNVRSAKNLISEIEFLIKEYNVREIFDDTGTFPGGAWLNSFCEEMINRGLNNKILFSSNFRANMIDEKTARLMKRAGFRKIKVGLESANNETLERINKGITVEEFINGCKIATKAGLDVHLTVMIGYPWESRLDVMKTLALSRELMEKGIVEMLQATLLIPYPGTKLYDEALRNNWFVIDNKAYERFDMTEPVLSAPGFEKEEIVKLCREIYKSFLQPRFILRNMLKVRTIEDLSYILRGSKAVYGHLKDFFGMR